MPVGHVHLDPRDVHAPLDVCDADDVAVDVASDLFDFFFDLGWRGKEKKREGEKRAMRLRKEEKEKKEDGKVFCLFFPFSQLKQKQKNKK